MGRETNSVKNSTLQTEWSVQTFDILDPTNLWAPAVSRELADRWNNRTGIPSVAGWTTFKQFQAGTDSRTSQGLILFFDGIEKECLSILRRLLDAPQQCSTAAVLSHDHQDLVPVLVESNVVSIIMEPVNDVPIADWCLAVFDLANSKTSDSERHHR